MWVHVCIYHAEKPFRIATVAERPLLSLQHRNEHGQVIDADLQDPELYKSLITPVPAPKEYFSPVVFIPFWVWRRSTGRNQVRLNSNKSDEWWITNDEVQCDEWTMTIMYKSRRNEQWWSWRMNNDDHDEWTMMIIYKCRGNEQWVRPYLVVALVQCLRCGPFWGIGIVVIFGRHSSLPVFSFLPLIVRDQNSR